MLIIVCIVVSVCMTFAGHVLSLHGDLPHMRYTVWYEYVFETLFYMFFWAVLWYHYRNDYSRKRYEEAN